MGTAWYPPPVETSIAVDFKGHPRITYRDRKKGCLKYGYYDGKGWVNTIIDTKGYAGKGNSITLAQGQAPVVTYIANDGLRIARWYKGRWDAEVIDPKGWAAGDHAIVIDRAGVIHIAYLTIPSGTPSKLMYCRIADSAREFEIISNREFVPPKRRKDVSIAVSRDGLPFVSFTSWAPSGGLKVCRKSDSKWVFDSTIAGREVGLDTSIAIDNGGKVHVSYFSGPALTYAFFDGNAWVEETVDYNKVQRVGLSNSLAVSANGVPHIAYLGADADLKYANRLGGKWHVETVDSKGSVGWCCSIALDANDRPHISYHDRSKDAVKYACLVEP